ncbi:MAG TPA: AAA family ATPase [Solirubrobacteraceae bacterium]|jgi:DNA-binding CsgD family transcriptional regulator
MELLERDVELGAIRRALGRAREGEGGLLGFEGPAGIGKTRLLRAAQALAEEQDLLVLVARGGELETEFPHGIVRQLVERPLLAATPEARAAALTGPAAVAAAALGVADEAAAPAAEGADDRAFAVLHGLYWLVANLAADRPVLLCVDDVQWADAPSLRFLVYLARRLEGLPVLTVVTVRSGERGADPQLLHELLADAAAELITPRPLSEAAAAELLRSLLDRDVDRAFAATCHQVTNGNPFLLRQLADAVRADGVDPTSAAADRVRALGPRTVARSILLRLGHQSDAAARLARALAVLGVEAPLRDAAALAGLDPADAARAADELRAIDMLDQGADPAFVHPIVRSAIYADIPQAERGAMHAAAARVLLSDGALPRDVAPHLLSADPAGDPEVAATLRQAATRAQLEGAPAIAVRFLERAIDEPPPEADRPDVMYELGRAHLVAGDTAAAARVLEQSVRATKDPRQRAQRHIPLGRALAAAEGAAAAIAALEEGIALAEEIDRDLALRVEAELAAIGVLRDTFSQGLGERLERYAHLPGTSAAECLVLANLARHAALSDRTAAEAAEIAKRAIGGGLLLHEEGAESIPLHHALFVLLLCDEVDLARTTLENAFADARDGGSVFGVGVCSLTSAFIALRCGELMVAEAEARAALAAFGGHAAYWPIPVSVMVHSLVERADLEAAEDVLREYDALRAMPDMLSSSRLLIARATLRLQQERHDEALADLVEVGEREARWGIRDIEIGWRSLAALVHWHRGDEPEAQRLAGEHLELARGWGTATAIGGALRMAGLVGPLDDASLRCMEEAVEHLQRSPAVLERARALIDLGAALRRRGRRTDAREPLRQGVELARSIQALALAERGHEELIAAGARPRRLQFSGAESLTASERRVAELAAAGHGNREIAQTLFVTIKTVENHLARAYQKLGIKSRGELPQALGTPQPVA